MIRCDGRKVLIAGTSLDTIQDFDEILEKSDGSMIARGDMGVEVDYARLPGIQKSFIDKCNRAGLPLNVSGNTNTIKVETV
ncbi:MAG: pyruvate kinase [Bilifractor sp.]